MIKLDTVKRLAELLKISPLSLLGIGVEYYSRPVGFLERGRQIEETADQILQVSGPLSYLITSDAYDTTLAALYEEAADAAGEDRASMHTLAEQVLGIMSSRKRMYQARRPGIIALIPAGAVQRLLAQGIGAGAAASESLRARCREVAASEVEHIADTIEAEPMGLQFGLLPHTELSSSFEIMRSRDRAVLAMNPFRPDGIPGSQGGVAMVTAADEAITAHQRVAESLWREALKGAPAAAQLRDLVAAAR